MVKIGLECHVQLQTQTKLFCGCPNRFVHEPNNYVCETCLGFPGSKPRVNAKAVEFALKIGLALNCQIPKETYFSRKSYFYPDMSKNFQITQYEIPIASTGFLQIPQKKIRIKRIQIEEDPARLQHEENYVLVDYNRSGTPLCEIVTEPDFSSPDEARDFLQELSSMLEYLGVYDSSVEGSMRADANISVADTRVEIKNVSGFKEVERALNYEIIRQSGIIRRGQQIIQETRGWDPVAGVTKSMRAKETEEDYGYIFETDLPRIILSREKIEELRKNLPEFAPQKVERYVINFGITAEQAISIAREYDIATMFEHVVKHIDPKLAANFFVKALKKTLNFNNMRLKQTGLKKEHIIELLDLLSNNRITERAAELMIRDLVITPRSPKSMVESQSMQRIYDEKEIEKFIDQAISENARAVVDYRSGRKESFEFILGQALRKSKGRADPKIAREVLQRKLAR